MLKEAKYVERWPSTTSAWAGWSRFDIPVGIGMVAYILYYGSPAEHWGPLPATRLASRKILIEQNMKKRKGSSLCVLCGNALPTGRGSNVNMGDGMWEVMGRGAWELQYKRVYGGWEVLYHTECEICEDGVTVLGSQ
jgi:hypothetical protein